MHRALERLGHGRGEHAELLAPAHEVHRGHDRLGGDGRTGGGGLVHEVREQPPGRRVRVDAQLPLQHAGAVVVGAHRAGAVAHPRLDPDQVAVADLVDRVQLDAPPRGPERDRPPPGPSGGVGHPLAHLDALGDQLVAPGEGPVVVQAGQQLAAVRRQRGAAVLEDGRGVVGLGREHPLASPLELAEVHPAGVAVAPGEVGGGHHQRVVVRQRPAQLVELAAQVGEGLLLGGGGPERRGDPHPRLRYPGVPGQQRHERDRARRARADLTGRVVDDGALSQQGDLQHGALPPVASVAGHRRVRHR